MSDARAGFPLDWLESRALGAGTDLDLAVLLVNTVDLLEDPPDRLDDLEWLADAFKRVGHDEIAVDLRPRDLPRLRELRTALRKAFEASDAHAAAAALNPQLERAGAVFLLVVDDPDQLPAGSAQHVRFAVGSGKRGIAALCARLPAAVAAQIARQGAERLGVCASDPCQCAFVDRTRAGTRRYCCSYCNDRAAARAYRQRKRT
jgi:predicted RNA-binding Zn ribbon-like protein